MTALEEIKKTNHPDRIWATVNGMSTRLPDGARQLVGGWSQDADRIGAVEYVLASTLESLQRENEELRKDRYDLAYAITGGEDAPGLLDSTPASEIVEIAQHAHRSHSADIDRVEATETAVMRLREAFHNTLERAGGGTFVAGQSFDMIEQRVKFLEKDIRDIARAALASTGGEDHAE
ncbi:hypothetical protein DXM27_10345 [Rhizobium rhizogenes]|uniref:Uncharacterized protein n=1 Tax=Rhizobium rhizogenes TaxID=359 RepID=A0AA88F287_RHIRH|nr:hypothetical protein [Rhizobium rhizogenes]KAA3503249.1 hypothetical protein DXM27_10345 [Rhizobium rhizogenes]